MPTRDELVTTVKEILTDAAVQSNTDNDALAGRIVTALDTANQTDAPAPTGTPTGGPIDPNRGPAPDTTPPADQPGVNDNIPPANATDGGADPNTGTSADEVPASPGSPPQPQPAPQPEPAPAPQPEPPQPTTSPADTGNADELDAVTAEARDVADRLSALLNKQGGASSQGTPQ